MILFAEVRKNSEWEKDLPAGSTTKMISKKCINTATFVELLQDFARLKLSGRFLLNFDGAKSHLDYSICEFTEENAILLYSLPSNITHNFQSIDKDFLGSFEIFWDHHALFISPRIEKNKIFQC